MTSTFSAPPSTASPEPGKAAPPPRPRFWRRPWVAPLMFVAAAFMALSVPRYLTFDPALTNVPAPDGFPAHYGLLVGHVLCGTIAMTTACFQVWPAFRARYPKAHRIMGRIYVFGGVLPGGVLACVVGAATPFGPVVRVANITLGVLWLVVTAVGFRMAIQRRYAEHRRWMVRSFALTFTIITTRVCGAIFGFILYGEQMAEIAGPTDPRAATFGAAGLWFGLLLHVVLAEWWLERGTPAQRKARKERRLRAARG